MKSAALLVFATVVFGADTSSSPPKCSQGYDFKIFSYADDCFNQVTVPVTLNPISADVKVRIEAPRAPSAGSGAKTEVCVKIQVQGGKLRALDTQCLFLPRTKQPATALVVRVYLYDPTTEKSADFEIPVDAATSETETSVVRHTIIKDNLEWTNAQVLFRSSQFAAIEVVTINYFNNNDEPIAIDADKVIFYRTAIKSGRFAGSAGVTEKVDLVLHVQGGDPFWYRISLEKYPWATIKDAGGFYIDDFPRVRLETLTVTYNHLGGDCDVHSVTFHDGPTSPTGEVETLYVQWGYEPKFVQYKSGQQICLHTTYHSRFITSGYTDRSPDNAVHNVICESFTKSAKMAHHFHLQLGGTC